MGRIFVPDDSTEYVAVAVTVFRDGFIEDLGSSPVEMAFRPTPTSNGGVVEPLVFVEAEWEIVRGTYYARALVGPASVSHLEPGLYQIWVKVYHTPQLPIRKSPTILEIRPT